MLRRLYTWTIAKAADRRAVWWLALFAFVEASFFPIPPHPVLGLMCLAQPKKAVRYAAVATLASTKANSASHQTARRSAALAMVQV